jgi:hypothetical protein
LRVIIEASFLKEARKLPSDRARAIRRCVEKFQLEPKLPSLKFRPLLGVPGYFIINSIHGDRVILRKDDEKTYAAVDTGPHDNDR